jgi:hypothetical protein
VAGSVWETKRGIVDEYFFWLLTLELSSVWTTAARECVISSELTRDPDTHPAASCRMTESPFEHECCALYPLPVFCARLLCWHTASCAESQ